MLGLEDLFPHPTHQNPNAAPYFEVPNQKIAALEHPCLVHDVDNAVKSFGLNPNFHKVSPHISSILNPPYRSMKRMEELHLIGDGSSLATMLTGPQFLYGCGQGTKCRSL